MHHNYLALTCGVVTVLTKIYIHLYVYISFSSHSLPPFCGCRSSGFKLTVCVSAFNFLHHLTTYFYVTVFFKIYFYPLLYPPL